MKKTIKTMVLFSLVALISLTGCSGKNGNNGINGKNGTNGTNGESSPFLTVTSNSGQQAQLTWTQLAGATSYKVYSSTVAGGPYSAMGTTTVPAYVLTGLITGTTYYFVVTAVLSSGESPYSNVVSFRPYAMYAYPGFHNPIGIAIDNAGNVWVTNEGDNTVSELSPTTVAGIYQTIATYDVSSNPYGGIAIDNTGNIWVTNEGNNSVTELSPTSTPGIYQTNTTYDVGYYPYGIAIDKSGNVFVVNECADSICNNGSVTELSSTSTPGIFQTNTTYDVGLYSYVMAFDASGNAWVVNECADSSCNNGSVTELSPTSTPGIYQTITTFMTGYESYGIAIDKSSNVLVVNYGAGNNGSVTELSPDGTGGYFTYTTYTAGIGYEPEGGIAIDNSGNVWITNYCADSNCNNASVTELSPIDGTNYYFNTAYDFPGYGYGIAIDAFGNIWLTDDNNTVTELNGITTGPQSWPYAGPVFPGNGFW